ncbi:hypothetical protein [Bartonella taylorii]|uniref:Uncharacterized protein n=1 Tax=Bartonella taylorii TaxID=33046 RepID=A0A9Q8YWI2_BARTA|nr:hypothetical protein [Bartonella taylorii]USP02369.1 hypothetical protein LAJ60_05675 [Bartonella taylorii]
MNHKESFTDASIVTTFSLFSSIAEGSHLDVCALSYLSDTYGSAVESEYKLPTYKLWQSLKKNKPSIRNKRGVYFFHKKHSRALLDAVSYQSFLKRVKQIENNTIQSASTNPKEWSPLESSFSFYERNGRSIDWRNVFGFIPHIHTIARMLAHAQNILRQYKIYSRKEQDFRRNKLTSPSYENTVWQYSKKPHRVGVCIHKISYHRVYCS